MVKHIHNTTVFTSASFPLAVIVRGILFIFSPNERVLNKVMILNRSRTLFKHSQWGASYLV